MHPIPFPVLLPDRQAYIVRAHRMRGAVVVAVALGWVVVILALAELLATSQAHARRDVDPAGAQPPLDVPAHRRRDGL